MGTVHLGHEEIEEHEVGVVVLGQSQSLVTGIGAPHDPEALAVQKARDQVPDLEAVIDDQDGSTTSDLFFWYPRLPSRRRWNLRGIATFLPMTLGTQTTFDT